MKQSIWFSCSILFFQIFCNQIQISTSEPLSLTVIAVSSGLLTIFAYIEQKLEKWTEVSTNEVPQKQIRFLDSIEIAQFHKEQMSISDEIRTMVGEIPNQQSLDDLAVKVSEYIEEIDDRYRQIVLYKKAKLNGTRFVDLDKSQLHSITRENLGVGKYSIFELINKIYHNVIGRRDGKNVVKLTYDLAEQNLFKTCSTGKELQSFQQSLQKLLERVFMAYLKGYLTIRFSVEFLQEYEPNVDVTHSVTLSGTMKKLETVMNDTLNDFKESIKIAPRDIWLCDPKKHKEDITYVKLKYLFRKHIFPQYLLERQQSDGPTTSCTTANFREVKWSETYLMQGTRKDPRPIYPIRQCATSYAKCNDLGQIIGVSGNYGYEITYDIPNAGERQFEKLVISGDGQTKMYGSKNLAQWRPHSRSPRTGVFRKPDYFMPDSTLCICECDDAIEHVPFQNDGPHSDRFIYTGQVIADDNYVITGVRLAKLSGVIYPQIQQGKLFANGDIDEKSLNWKVLSKSDVRENNTLKLQYHTDTIQMEDIDLPQDRVLVGLSFSPKEPTGLILYSRRFEFATGKVYHDTLAPAYGSERSNDKQTIDNEDMDLPKAGEKSTQVATNVIINFATSNFLNDLGQTTVPFLDIQNVTTTVPTPMSGAGLYYKFRKGFAGFLGIKLKTYDVSHQINALHHSDNVAAEKIFDKLSKIGEI